MCFNSRVLRHKTALESLWRLLRGDCAISASMMLSEEEDPMIIVYPLQLAGLTVLLSMAG